MSHPQFKGNFFSRRTLIASCRFLIILIYQVYNWKKSWEEDRLSSSQIKWFRSNLIRECEVNWGSSLTPLTSVYTNRLGPIILNIKFNKRSANFINFAEKHLILWIYQPFQPIKIKAVCSKRDRVIVFDKICSQTPLTLISLKSCYISGILWEYRWEKLAQRSSSFRNTFAKYWFRIR